MSFLRTLQARGLISESALPRLERFVDLILEWNERINLTGLRNRSEIEEILVGDAVLSLRFIPVSSRDVLDFGSGAGIPGLVWTLCDPSAKVTSVESRQKKVAFQKEVLRTIGAKADIVCGRFPEVVEGRRYDIVVSRAIRFSPALWESARGFLRVGGILVRFSKLASSEEGWEAHPLSGRSKLLVSRS